MQNMQFRMKTDGFHGEEVPYSSFELKKFPLGHVLWKSLKAREVTMYDLYIPLVRKPNPTAWQPLKMQIRF